jgi:hypothetical protein
VYVYVYVYVCVVCVRACVRACRVQLRELLRVGNMSQGDFDAIEAAVNATLEGVTFPPLNDLDWDVASGKAFFFVVTVVTSIGYGFSAPTTTMGKLITMLLASVGVATCVVGAFARLRERLSPLPLAVCGRHRRRRRRHSVARLAVVAAAVNVWSLRLRSPLRL